MHSVHIKGLSTPPPGGLCCPGLAAAAVPGCLPSPWPTPHLLPSVPTPLVVRHTPSGGCPPLLLVVGTSMVRHVSVSSIQTFCYPGACIKDITPTTLQVIQKHSSTTAVVVQAGTNNIKKADAICTQVSVANNAICTWVE